MARKNNPTAKGPGSFRRYQAVYFSSEEDSDFEDGRGPKRKVVRLNPDASMQNAADEDGEGSEEMEVCAIIYFPLHIANTPF